MQNKYICPKENCNVQIFLNKTYNIFNEAGANKDCLSGLKVWLSCSKNDTTSIYIRSIYECLLKSLDVEILDADINGIISGNKNYDALIMFTLTVGVSARALELAVTSKFDKKIEIEKLYINMPNEFKGGYIDRNLDIFNIKYWEKDDFLNEPVFKHILLKLMDISRNKERELRLKFEPKFLIMTALAKEFDAMRLMLDDNTERKDNSLGDKSDLYIHGKIGNNNVVIAMSGIGNNLSAAITSTVLNTYPSIEYIIMTGIAGGIPYLEKPDEFIRLGDIVVCDPKGVVQYDIGKKTKDGFEHKVPPRPPCATTLSKVQLHVERNNKKDFKYWKYIDDVLNKKDEKRPPNTKMSLSDTPWIENSESKIPAVQKGFQSKKPRIHFGVIASGNNVVKEKELRDYLKSTFSVKALEMESSGVADTSWVNNKPYFVVRGICDYCNPDKNDIWQQYAAISAAAFTKEIIELFTKK